MQTERGLTSIVKLVRFESLQKTELAIFGSVPFEPFLRYQHAILLSYRLLGIFDLVVHESL